MKTATAEDPIKNQELPDPAPPTETESALNKLISALMPLLNTALVNAIVASGGDPWKDVIVPPNGIYSLGEATILGVKTAAQASYTVKNMKGLSSLVLTSMKAQALKDPNAAQKVNASIPSRTVTGTLSVSAKLSKNLAATLGGKVAILVNNAEIMSIGLSGQAIAKTVTATAKGEFTATVGYPKTCFTVLTLNNFLLNYEDIDVDIPNDFGIYDFFLNPLVDSINHEYGSQIKGKISQGVQPELNKLIKSVLPLCIDVSSGKTIK